MSQKTDPILARVNASPSQNLIEVTDVGQGLVWALNEENASWFKGVGAPTSFLGQLPGNLYLDTSSNEVYQLGSDGLTWTQVANVTQNPFDNSANVATTAYADSNLYGIGIAYFREDFISGNVAWDGVGIASEMFFDTPWWSQQVGEGSAIGYEFTGGSNSAMGVLHVYTGATSGYGAMFSKDIGYYYTQFGQWAGDYLQKIQIDIRFQLGSTSHICFRAGFCMPYTGEFDPPSDGIWLRYDTAASDSDFMLVSSVFGTPTATSTGVAADTNYHHLTITNDLNDAALAIFSLDGGAGIAIPVGTPEALGPFFQILTRTSSAASLNMDFFSVVAQREQFQG